MRSVLCSLLLLEALGNDWHPARLKTQAQVEVPTTAAPEAAAPTTSKATQPAAATTTAAPTTAAPTTAKQTQAAPAPPKAQTPGTLNPIVVKGEFLYDSVTQERFFAKGIDYNPRPATYGRSSEDPSCQPGDPPYNASWFEWGQDLVDDDKEMLWSEDLDAIAELGANTVRLYNVNPDKSHAKFMKKAAKLGLYVIVPLTRADWGWLPAGYPSPDCYASTMPGYGNIGTNLLVSAKLIVKQFSQYSNVLFFTVGNEVETNDAQGIAALPCVKSLTRDIHKFQSDCALGMRRVPLLYAATDTGGSHRLIIAQYLTCESDTSDDIPDAVDVYGLNIYSWCDSEYLNEQGEEDFTRSPYYEIEKDMGTFNFPLLFTEFGCKLSEFRTSCPYKGGRTWVELNPIMGRMAQMLSGAFAYSYSMEGAWQDQEYGLVLKPGYIKNQTTLTKLDEYYNLQKMYKKLDISKRWDAQWTDATRCTWDPAVGPFAPNAELMLGASLTTKRKPRACPSAERVATFFHEQGHAPNTWFDSLAPTPPDSNVVECPRYDISSSVLKESMCYQSSPGKAVGLIHHWSQLKTVLLETALEAARSEASSSKHESCPQLELESL